MASITSMSIPQLEQKLDEVSASLSNIRHGSKRHEQLRRERHLIYRTLEDKRRDAALAKRRR